MDELVRPFTFEFFRQALVVATLAGALCGLVGCYVVLRGMSYLGHGLAHAILGGFAASELVGVSFLVGAGVWGVACALLIGRIARRRVSNDAAIAVVTTASFALGLAMIQLLDIPAGNAEAALFGNVLGVTTADIVTVALVAALTLAFVVLRYRALLFTTFDPEVAGASGVGVARLDAMLLVVLALAVLASMNVMGVTLVAAAIVVPAATARLVTRRFSRLLVLSTALGAASGFGGMILSYHLDVASGPTIVLVDAACFGAAYAWSAARHRRPGPLPEAVAV